MKQKPSFPPSPLSAFLILGIIAVAAIVFNFKGFIEMELNKNGGRMLIDGRPPVENSN
jgi:hypothetical protein